MPIHEILTALWVSALAVDSATIIARLAKLCEAAWRRWQEHKRE